MTRKMLLTLPLALALASPASLDAAPVTLIYTGTLAPQFPPSDPLSLDGVTFSLTLTFDSAATRTGTNGVNVDRFGGVGGTLIVNGGTYGIGRADEGPGTSNDIITIVPTSGPVIGISIYLPSGFTGAISPTNTFTPFVTSNVFRDNWLITSATGVPEHYVSNSRSATYTVQPDPDPDPDPPTPSVPEPASLLLLGAGVLGLAARRRS